MKVATLESGIFLRYREGDPGLPTLLCIHGYGASGSTFLEAFAAPALARHPICVPDLPGFGHSPLRAHPSGLSGAADVVLGLIAELTGDPGVILLVHSAGGLIGTTVAQALPGLRSLINVEGNVTEADNFISGKAAAADDIEAWRRGLVGEIRGLAAADEAYRRYLNDLERASPAALKGWALDIVARTGRTDGGDRFRALACPKLYVYGGRSIAPASLKYLERYDVPRLAFPEAGHSPMIDEPVRFYEAVAEFIAARRA